MSLNKKEFIFEASDGYPLSGCHYAASYSSAISAVGRIIIASATGVPQEFYRRFATFATAHHYEVVTFDYRGIGKSAPASLKGFRANFADWAAKDLQALVDKMHDPSLPLFYIGHSFGGHALGLLTNHQPIQAACFLGVGAGWHGWMSKLEQIRVRSLWHLVAPVITRTQGYLRWSLLGMGEDLPLGVYQQWKHWCSFPNYFFDDPLYPEMKNRFAEVKTPIKAINALDDQWAPPRSRDAFMQHYRGSAVTIQNLDPASMGLTAMGHMGYFRSSSQALWSDILDFFAEQQL